MNKITLPPKVDENGDYCDDLFLYSIQDCCDCGPFVPAKVLEDCRSQGRPYVCLDIPGLRYNVVIELDDPDRSRS
jgi:hypothetical protein